jgi:hypothetical protein
MVVTAALAVVGLCATARAEDPAELPAPPGYDRAVANDLNDWAQAVGQATALGAPRQAVIWRKPSLRWWKPRVVEPLPTLPGMVDSEATRISRSGIPVGSSSLLAPGMALFRAVVWRRLHGQWEPVELEPLPGYTEAIASSVNARGQVVGWTFNPGEIFEGDVVRRAVLWQPARGGDYTAIELQTPDGFQTSADDINDTGDVVGRAYRTEFGDAGPFLRSDVVVWRVTRGRHGCGRSLVVLDSLPGLPENLAPAISARGDVVSFARGFGNGTVAMRPAFWTRHHWKRHRWKRRRVEYREPVALPVPDGFTDAIANDVNARRQVVGTAYVVEGTGILASRAVSWLPRARGWTVVKLPTPEEVAFSNGAALNELGWAVGSTSPPPTGSSGALLWKKTRKPHRHGHGHEPESKPRSLGYRDRDRR